MIQSRTETMFKRNAMKGEASKWENLLLLIPDHGSKDIMSAHCSCRYGDGYEYLSWTAIT